MKSMMTSPGVDYNTVTKPMLTLEMGEATNGSTKATTDLIHTMQSWMHASCQYNVNGWEFYTWNTPPNTNSGKFIPAEQDSDAFAIGLSPAAYKNVCPGNSVPIIFPPTQGCVANTPSLSVVLGASTDATRYDLYRSTTGTDYTKVASISRTQYTDDSYTYTDTYPTLQPGSYYTYWVWAYNENNPNSQPELSQHYGYGNLRTLGAMDSGFQQVKPIDQCAPINPVPPARGGLTIPGANPNPLPPSRGGPVISGAQPYPLPIGR